MTKKPWNIRKSIGQDLPICQKCNKTVDSFVEGYNSIFNNFFWIAKCHGGEEKTTLTKENYEKIWSMPKITSCFQTNELNLPNIPKKNKEELRFLLNTKENYDPLE